MLSAAFAMFVCGCLSVLVPREKLPSIAETLTMCLLAARRSRSISGLSLPQRMNGRDRVDELDLEHLGGRRPRASVRRQLFIVRGGRPAAGRRRAGPRGRQVAASRLVLERVGDERERGRGADAEARAVRRASCGERRARVDDRRVGPSEHAAETHSSWLAEQRAGRCSGSSAERPALELEQVRVEAGRPAHGLGGVVDQDVEPRRGSARGSARRSRRSASDADRARAPGGGRPTRAKSGSRA